MTPYDRWLTYNPHEPHEDEPQPELEYKCPKCGHTPDEHPEVPTPDGNNVMQVCPPKCTGCDQIISITDGKSECGGEGEGICCIFADDEDPCPFHPDGHDPSQVILARASHQEAFRILTGEDWHLSDDCGEEYHTSPNYVLGAVLAQLEDLPLEERVQVLEQALEIQSKLGDDLPFLTPEGECPRCKSDHISYVDDDYAECCDCGWSGAPNPTTAETRP